MKNREEDISLSIQLLLHPASIALKKLLLQRKIFVGMPLITKVILALTLNDPHDDA